MIDKNMTNNRIITSKALDNRKASKPRKEEITKSGGLKVNDTSKEGNKNAD